MLPKAKRLGRSDFSRKPIRASSFMFGSVRMFSGEPGAAVVVSKKTCPLAVDRNRLRRRVYAILGPLLEKGGLSKPVVVSLNARAGKASFAELKQELERALPH
jgi:ribonuclease P protein component